MISESRTLQSGVAMESVTDRMQYLLKGGSILFAVAMASFGIRYLMYAISATRLAPDPPWTPGGLVWAWLSGIVLIAGAASVATWKNADLAGLMLGSLLMLHILILHLPHLVSNLHNPNDWTGTFELLAMCGGALVLAAACRAPQRDDRLASVLGRAILLGRILFALSLLVFGIQHCMYARFVATLIPIWIMGHLFWAYFTGAAFLVTAVCIVVRYHARLAALWLGIMFLLWVLLLHLPRVAAAPHDGKEWTSAFVALAMCGASFIVAGSTGDPGPGKALYPTHTAEQPK